MPVTVDKDSVISSSQSSPYVAGEALGRGQPVHLDTSNQAVLSSNASGGGLEKVRGLALQDVAAGQPVQLSTNGSSVELGAGAALSLGTDVYLGAAGALILGSEFVGGEEVTHIGTAISATAIEQNIVETGGQA